MPNAEQITTTLSQLSQSAWWLAAAWHVYVIAFGAALALKWRPSKRLAGSIMAMPLVSVVSMAWVSGNPFTTVVLGLVFIGALAIASRLQGAVSLAALPRTLAGVLLLVFGLVYPHFLDDASLVTYLYSAPVGIVPCPTLSVMVGSSLILRSLGSKAWGLLIGFSSFLYGVIGALYLNVVLDWVLLAGAIVLLVTCWFSRSISPAEAGA